MFLFSVCDWDCELSRTPSHTVSTRRTGIHSDRERERRRWRREEREKQRKQGAAEGAEWRNGKMEGGERKPEGGGKCQMVRLRASVSDGRLQRDGCHRREEITQPGAQHREGKVLCVDG